MSKRISVYLKKDLHKQLQQRAKKTGSTKANLIRAWLSNCGEINEIHLHRDVSKASKHHISYSIYLEPDLLDSLDEVAAELNVTRNALVNSIIERQINSDQGNANVQTTQTDLSFLKEYAQTLSLNEFIYQLLNSKPFKPGYISGGLVLKEGRHLKVMGVTNYYFQRIVDKILPIPIHTIKFDLYNQNNLLTKSVNTKSIQITTRLRDLLTPLLIPFVWDRMQKFVGAHLIAIYPLEYKSQMLGALVVGVHSVKFDVETMNAMEHYSKNLAAILSEKLYNQPS